MSTFVKEYEQLFSPRVTRFSKGTKRAYMIDLGGSFSPCFDTLEDLGNGR